MVAELVVGARPVLADVTPNSNVFDVVSAAKKKQATSSNGAATKGKKSKKVVELSDDDGEGEEGSASGHWTDREVLQLIHFHQQMDEDFEQNAKKQGKIVIPF
ncbi:unnamed protein product [Calypogeia fissa]